MASFHPIQLNRRITLASRPVGLPKLSDFHLVYSQMPSPATGEVLFRSIYLSLDPWLRWRINGKEAICTPPVGVGDLMAGDAVARVVASEDPELRPGDTVEGMLGWQEYGIAKGSDLRKIEPGPAPISASLSVLGIPGLTAYFGLLDVTDPQPGETVVVSGAAGAVGMLVGQIAKIRGCRVVGVAASGAKCTWLREELGFDECCSVGPGLDLDDKLAELCPKGIDVYFDNVGGAVSDAALRRINRHARVALCGRLPQSERGQGEPEPQWLGQLIVKEAKVEGFKVSNYVARFAEGLAQLRAWLQAGRLKYREQIAQGLEAAPQAFIGVLLGKNQGEQLVQLTEP